MACFVCPNPVGQPGQSLGNRKRPCLWQVTSSPALKTILLISGSGVDQISAKLKWARPELRELTHTLQLPPAPAEIYEAPHPEWLGHILEALPNLQSLLVPWLPFFDHQALLALRSRSWRGLSVENTALRTYALRLLIAANCRNLTVSGLAEGLAHLPNLAFLDLSGNSSARDRSVLSQFCRMHDLHILRLQNCQLRDSDMQVLAPSIGLRVRSLDLCSNNLTNNGIRNLLEHCFRTRGTRSRTTSGVVVEDSAVWPHGTARPNTKILDEFRDEALNERFVKRLTSGIINRLPSQDLRESGITHLYLAHNHLSGESILNLVKVAQLYVLDIGSLNTSKLLNKPRTTPSSSPPSVEDYPPSLYGAEELAPILANSGEALTYLRLHHSVVSLPARPKEEATKRESAELESCMPRDELDSPHSCMECQLLSLRHAMNSRVKRCRQQCLQR